ncbi:MAG TPA: hypothetical protein VGY53_11860 [Isosphaeraceae bacterium]|jgi:hypothetical protein|nr:hypothetical protein [Isosphaeraceae bacterium]
MSGGSTKLQYALQNLRMRWEEAQEMWNDSVRVDFDNKHLKPLETQVSATVRAMEKIGEIMAKMKQECS